MEVCPNSLTKCRAVFPSWSARLRSDPPSLSARTISEFPLILARCNGDLFNPDKESTFTSFFSRSALIISRWPSLAAKCRGVQASRPVQFTSADRPFWMPSLNRFTTDSRFPHSAAVIRFWFVSLFFLYQSYQALGEILISCEEVKNLCADVDRVPAVVEFYVNLLRSASFRVSKNYWESLSKMKNYFSSSSKWPMSNSWYPSSKYSAPMLSSAN